MDKVQYDIFISYSRKDFDKVKAIKEEIEKYTSIECWMDLSAIESGDPSFVDAIARGICNCKIFLFMLSNHSQNSRYAIGEMELARELGKRNILINNDDCSMTPSFFLLYSHSNMRNWNMFEEKKQLLSDLKSWLGKENSINVHEVETKLRSEYENSLGEIEDKELRTTINSRLKAQSAARDLQYMKLFLQDLQEDYPVDEICTQIESTEKARQWVKNEVERLKKEEKRLEEKEKSKISE